MIILKKFINYIKHLINKINYKFISIGLTLSFIPQQVYAFDSSKNMFFKIVEELGNDAFSGVSLGTIKAILVITVLRFLVEFSKGGSKYRFYDIAKQCVAVILMITILPYVPTILQKITNIYIDAKLNGGM